MRRILFTALAAGLLTAPAFAAAPKIDAAVKTFKSLSADQAKMKTFCEMSKVMASAGEKEDKAADAKIEGLMKQLGPDFEKAWSAGDDLTETSPDAKVYQAAMDDLMNKCPK
jgi:hypothetical protein